MQGPLPSNADPRILAAIEAVYGALNAPNPRVIEGCPCCMDSRKPDVLLTTPPRQIAPGDLYRYITGAFFTVGGPRDFRYLAPRILEVTVLHPGETPNPEIALRKLALAEWEYWAPRERAAVIALIDAWFDNALANDIRLAEAFMGGSDAEAVLCGAALAGLDITPWLTRLAGPEATAVRAEMARMNATALERGYPTGFWEDAPAAWAEFARAVST